MSAFTPLDVRAPVQRRKQLIQKLMAQQAAGGAGMAPSTIPGRGPVGVSEGRTFRNATDIRRPGALPITQAADILPSILARLGVVGKSLASEVSPGQGLAIDVPHPDHVQEPGDVQHAPDPVKLASGGADGGTPAPPDSPAPSPAPVAAPATDNAADRIPAPVPLGNGYYYDPLTDSFRGLPTGFGFGVPGRGR